MKVDLLTPNSCEQIVTEQTSARFDFCYKELTKLRKHLFKLEEEIKCLKEEKK